MKKYIVTVTSLVILIFLASGMAWAEGVFEEVFKEKGFEVGLALEGRSVRLKSEGVPNEVKREAANPSIVNPYSGRRFGIAQIGTYSPEERFNFAEFGLYGKYTPSINYPLVPYFRLELQCLLGASTHEGSYGEGYTYERVLGSGVDYVRYIYGIKYRNPTYLEPEVGLSYVKKDSFSVSAGLSYQRLVLTYYKGIEAWGEPEGLQKLGTSRHNLFNCKFNFTKLGNGFVFSLEPSVTFGNEVDGFGAAVSLGARF